ncbi:MAG TPA: hypothetical protein VFU44_06230 [Candidatus Limnocylindria bacterium]|jgi:hypothetical protein|nr:hypothetical protein [Candidatus Limnocylindria bacterium]
MVGWGIFLLILGAGSLLLPSLGFQFRLMELVDAFQPYAGIVVAVIGAGLLLLGMTRGRQTTVEVSQRPAASNVPAEAASDDSSQT